MVVGFEAEAYFDMLPLVGDAYGFVGVKHWRMIVKSIGIQLLWKG